MLAPYFRFQVMNLSGLTLADENVVISFRPWKFGPQGQLVYGDEVVLNPTGNISNGSVGVTAAQDNTGDAYLGLTGGHFSVTTASGTLASNPQVILFFQVSPDGTSWPDLGEGTLLSVVTVSTAGAPEQRSFEV